MSKIKSLVAGLLAGVIALSFAACRTKDEIAVTFSDGENQYEMRSAIYFYQVMMADSDFRSQVYEQLSEDENADLSNIDYESQTLDDKDYETWVKDKAMEYSQDFAYVELTFDKLGLEIDQETLDSIDSNAQTSWENGAQDYFEPNGISLSSFKLLNENSYKKDQIYSFYYNEPDENETPTEQNQDAGSKRPAKDEIDKAIEDNFVLVDEIIISLTETDENGESTTLSDTEKKEAEEKLNGYADRLKAGESFSEIYIDYNGSDLSQKSEAKDPYASLYGGEDTADYFGEYYSQYYESAYYDDYRELKAGEPTVEKFDDAYVLVVRQEVATDPYYVEMLSDIAVSILCYDDFSDDVTESAKALKVTQNESAINFYKPSKIDYGTTTTMAATVTTAG